MVPDLVPSGSAVPGTGGPAGRVRARHERLESAEGLAPSPVRYLLAMRDWTIELESEPYVVAEHERGAFNHAIERLETELSGSADVFGTVVGIPLDGSFSATFSVRAKTAGEAAGRGCEIFLLALEEALRPLRFPLESELGLANGIDEPVIASVTARNHQRNHQSASVTARNNDAPGLSDMNSAPGEVEINGYLVTSDTVHELAARLRALPGEWNRPAAKVALQLEMSAERAGEPSLHVDGPECDAVSEALQKWLGEITGGRVADELIALLQGLARETAE